MYTQAAISVLSEEVGESLGVKTGNGGGGEQERSLRRENGGVDLMKTLYEYIKFLKNILPNVYTRFNILTFHFSFNIF